MADIFSADPIAPEDVNITLDTLVGDDRKYKTPDELAKAYAHAEPLIESQKAELARLAAENKVLKDLEDARLRGRNNPDPDPVNDRQQQPDPNHQKRDDVDINKLVREELQNASEEKRKADNINAAAEVMNRHYGNPSKAQEAIAKRAEELGVSFEWLKEAASNSPKAFLASMGINPDARPNNTPGYRNEVNINHGGNVKNFQYFDNLRKSDPKAYFGREIQKQMFDARRELGEKFYTS